MPALVYGLIAMVGIGTLNILMSLLTKKEDNFKVGFLIQVAGFLILLGLYPLFPQGHVSVTNIVTLLISGIFGATAFVFMNKAFATGNASINSPLISTGAVVTSILSFLFLGERAFLMQILGILIIVAGIFITSVDLKSLKSQNISIVGGAKYAVTAAFLIGVAMFLLAYTTTQENWYSVNLFYRSFVTLTYIFMAFKSKPKFSSYFKSIPILVLFAGIIDVIAMLAVNIGYTKSEPSTVSILMSANSIVTITLAYFLLKEKLTKQQFIGIVIVISGIFLLAIT